MSANAAIAFFLIDQIVNPGQKSPKGNTSSGADDAAFAEYYNRAVQHSIDGLSLKAASNDVSVVNTEKSAVFSVKDSSAGGEAPFSNECLSIDENCLSQFQPDLLFTQENDSQDVELQEVATTQTMQQNQEQSKRLYGENSIKQDKPADNGVNPSFFAQQGIFFPQNKPDRDNQIFSPKGSQTILFEEMGTEEPAVSVFNNASKTPDKTPDNAQTISHDVQTASITIKNQPDDILIGHKNFDAVGESKATPLFFNIVNRANDSNETQATATAEEAELIHPHLDSDSSILEANQKPIHKKDINQTESMQLNETSEKTPANEAHIERAPQGSDVELTIQQAPEHPMRSESVQSAVQVPIEKNGEESGDKNQKTIQITRSALHNLDNSEAKNEIKQDSSGAGKDHSSKDPTSSGKDSAIVQDMNRFSKTEKSPEVHPFQQKMEASSKTSSISMNQNEAKSESQKSNSAHLSVSRSRDAAMTEAAPPSRTTQVGQSNASSDQAAIQNQPPASTAASPASNGAASSQPASMIQHYAEKIVEVQEAAAKQIVRAVQGSIGADRSQITMRLNPESLGRIHVQMSMENGSLTAQISADKENTRAMLNQSLHTLRAGFEDQGLKVDRLVVQKDSFQFKQNDPGRHEDSTNDPSKHRSGFERQNGQNHRRNQDSKQTPWTSWSDQMTSRDYFL